MEADPVLLIFIFFGTITGYNFVKYASIAGFQHFSLSKSLRIIQIYSFFCFIGLILSALKLPFPVLLAASVLGVLNLFYALPVLSEQRNLRSITGAKILVIAFIWTGVTVWLPALDSHLLISLEVAIISLQRFLFVIVLTLPFDIRDVRFDTEQLGTVPQWVGVRNTRNIGLLLLIIVMALELVRPSADLATIVILGMVSLITAWLLRQALPRQNKYYASFWVEGVPVFWVALEFLFTN